MVYWVCFDMVSDMLVEEEVLLRVRLSWMHNFAVLKTNGFT